MVWPREQVEEKNGAGTTGQGEGGDAPAGTEAEEKPEKTQV
jgi:hypothetical protein